MAAKRTWGQGQYYQTFFRESLYFCKYVIYLQKVLYMETTRTIQTAFRFRSETLRDLQNKARLEGKSVNRYVEELIESDIKTTGIDFLREALKNTSFPSEVSEDIKQLSTKSSITFSEEELNADDRLKYILNK